MIFYFFRIALGIAKHLFTKKKRLTDVQALTFRVWPILDSEDFSGMAASKYSEVCAVIAWVHGYTASWIRPAFQKGWYVFTRRSAYEFFRPLPIFRKVRLETKVLTGDSMSVIRQFEFYVGNQLHAKAYLQLVLTSKKGKVSTNDWMTACGEDLSRFEPWPESIRHWSYDAAKPA